MASKVKHNFKESALALLRGDWCNRVARRVSYWMGINGIDVTMPETPSENNPIKVGLNVQNAARILAGEMLSKNLLGRTVVAPLSVRAVVKENDTGIDHLEVYLPSLTVHFGGTAYAVQTGTETGLVQAVEGDWYKISGITTGTLYLVDASTTAGHSKTYKAKFATAALSTLNALSHFTATVSWDGTAKVASVEQYAQVMGGEVRNSKPEHADQYNENLPENDGGSSTPHAAYPLDQTEWKRGETNKVYNSGTAIDPNWETVQPPEKVGVKLQVVSRVQRVVNRDIFFWRWAYFDKNGMLIKLGKEEGCFFERNYDG